MLHRGAFCYSITNERNVPMSDFINLVLLMIIQLRNLLPETTDKLRTRHSLPTTTNSLLGSE